MFFRLSLNYQLLSSPYIISWRFILLQSTRMYQYQYVLRRTSYSDCNLFGEGISCVCCMCSQCLIYQQTASSADDALEHNLSPQEATKKAVRKDIFLVMALVLIVVLVLYMSGYSAATTEYVWHLCRDARVCSTPIWYTEPVELPHLREEMPEGVWLLSVPRSQYELCV